MNKNDIFSECELKSVIDILVEKGYVLESDSKLMYQMQYEDCFDNMKRLIYSNGYVGDINLLGLTEMGNAVWCIYDLNCIEYEAIYQILSKEALSQLGGPN